MLTKLESADEDRKNVEASSESLREQLIHAKVQYIAEPGMTLRIVPKKCLTNMKFDWKLSNLVRHFVNSILTPCLRLVK